MHGLAGALGRAGWMAVPVPGILALKPLRSIATGSLQSSIKFTPNGGRWIAIRALDTSSCSDWFFVISCWFGCVWCVTLCFLEEKGCTILITLATGYPMCGYSLTPIATTTTTSPVTSTVGCDSGWTKAGDRCYKYEPTFTTFSEAAALCSELRAGATLATICNEEQNQAAAGLITKSGDAWLGGRSGQGWLDGSSCSWNPGFETTSVDCYRIFAIEHQIYPQWGSMDCDSRSRHSQLFKSKFVMCCVFGLVLCVSF